MLKQTLPTLATFLKFIWQQFNMTSHCPRDLTFPWQPYFDRERERGSCHMKAWDCEGGSLMNDNARWMAVTGQRGEPGIRGKGSCTTRSRNCMVLLHRIVMRTPQGKNCKSERRSCCEGSKEWAERARRWLSLASHKRKPNILPRKRHQN